MLASLASSSSVLSTLDSTRGQWFGPFLFDSTQVADREEFLMSRRVTLFIDVEQHL